MDKVRHHVWAPNILFVISLFPQHMSIKSKDFSFCLKKVGNCTMGQLSGGNCWGGGGGGIAQLAIAHRELSGG